MVFLSLPFWEASEERAHANLAGSLQIRCAIAIQKLWARYGPRPGIEEVQKLAAVQYQLRGVLGSLQIVDGVFEPFLKLRCSHVLRELADLDENLIDPAAGCGRQGRQACGIGII